MSSILKNPTHRAQLGYNGFDMSCVDKFTSTVGELLPRYYDYLSPGDKVTCNVQMLTRTMELDSAAMMHLVEHIDWFFVPFEQLYKPFGSVYYGIKDLQSSNFVNAVSPNFPSCGLNVIANAMVDSQFESTFPFYSQFGSEIARYQWRLIESLGFPTISSGNAFVSSGTGTDQGVYTKIVPWLAAAYQKIYFDYYRLSDRELNDAEAYNLDRWYNSASISDTAIVKMFTLRYRPWKKDFFTNQFISPVFTDGSTSQHDSNNLNRVNQWLTEVSNVGIIAPSVGEDGTKATTVAIGDSSTAVYDRQFNPANVSTVFAVNKLLEITRRAGKHYDMQTLAHFGIDVPTGIAGEVMYLGSQSSDINIGDVIATAASETNALGQVGGKGYGSGSGHPITFTAPCHGVLMAIYSCVPEVDYSQAGLDRLNTYHKPQDMFIPEYDNLGMQPLFRYQSSFGSITSNSEILGWQYRYSELKTKFNRVTGGLKQGRTLAYWTTQRGGMVNSSLEQFLINPSYLDSVMLVNYDASAGSSIYSTDPLIHHFYFDVKKSAKMSTYGLLPL